MSRLYDDLETMLEARGVRRRADGSFAEDSFDYGVWWKDVAGHVYRLTWVGSEMRDRPELAGELYLVRLDGPHAVRIPDATIVSVGDASGAVELLCVVPPADCDRCTAGIRCRSSLDHRPAPDARVEALLDGWADVCGLPGSTDWVRDRAAEAQLLWPEAQQ